VDISVYDYFMLESAPFKTGVETALIGHDLGGWIDYGVDLLVSCPTIEAATSR
jgi:hypothetical protein